MDNHCKRSELATELERLVQDGLLSRDIASRASTAYDASTRMGAGAVAAIVELDEAAKSLEQSLKASRLELEMSETLAKIGSFRWSLRTGEDVWSDYIWQMLEYRREEVVPGFDAFIERVHPDDRSLVVSKLQASSSVGDAFELDFRLWFREGRIKYIRSRGRLDGPDHYLGVLMDVTELRTNETALEQIDAELAITKRQTELGEVAASIAHDLNQPLTSIAANAGATIRWLDRPSPEIGRAVESLKTLAKDARKAAGVLTGMQKLTSRPGTDGEVIEIDALLIEVAGTCGAVADTHKAKLVLDLDAASRVRGNAVQIGQVVYNLVLNGLESMKGSENERRVEITSCRLWNGLVEVAVSDRGTGMDEKIAGRVFDSFFTTKRTGMGLGLAICRSIVQRHGGTITVQSQPGSGTTFRFRLPIV